MNVTRLICIGLLNGALLIAPAQAAGPVHEHGAAAHHALTLDHGKRWATDAPLREGMATLRATMAAQMPAIHHDTLDASGYAALAAKLEPAVAGIFANCHLPPAADAQLHNVLLPMNAAIGRMKQAETVTARREAALDVISGLEGYGKFFEHPGWRPLE